ncbi:MAG TPA: DUF805 domain-containing protein [Lacipirellulaceae bacterium]|nr:DUF805 domain-containing protein [Lacipirellulaceae bacterium]
MRVDPGRSGWWQLIALIPLLGLIVIIVFCVLESDARVPLRCQAGAQPAIGLARCEPNPGV